MTLRTQNKATNGSTSGISVTTNPSKNFGQAGIAQSIRPLCKGSKYTLSLANQISVNTDANSFCRICLVLIDQVLATFVSLFGIISLCSFPVPILSHPYTARFIGSVSNNPINRNTQEHVTR